MNAPLGGRRILVTRPAAQAGVLAERIVARGGVPVLFPLLEILPGDDPVPLEQAVSRLDEYALAVFISPNAVEFSVPAILAKRPWPSGLSVAAIGQGTAARLAALGIADAQLPSVRFDSEALLALPSFQKPAVAGKRVLLVRGNGGRELLADTLRERGAMVDAVPCYRRQAPLDGSLLLSLLRNNRLQALTISSSEGLRNLLALLDTDGCKRLQRLPVFVPHPRIAELANELGLQTVVLTAPADAGIVEALCTYRWPVHE